MHGLDVERLLAVPAVAAAVVAGRRVLGHAPVLELPERERPVAVPRGVRVRVGEQPRGVVGVGDRHGLAAAEALAVAEAADAVGAAQLVGRVAADRVRQRLVLELRQRPRGLLAVVVRARRRVHERGGCAEVGRLHRVAERAEPGDRRDDRGERVGHRQVGHRRLRLRPVDEVVRERRAEGGRRRRRAARDLDEVVVRAGRVHGHPGLREPLRHLGDLRGRRRELRVVLVGGDELAVLGVRRVADGLSERVELVRVPRREPDPRMHGLAGRNRSGFRRAVVHAGFDPGRTCRVKSNGPFVRAEAPAVTISAATVIALATATTIRPRRIDGMVRSPSPLLDSRGRRQPGRWILTHPGKRSQPEPSTLLR